MLVAVVTIRIDADPTLDNVLPVVAIGVLAIIAVLARCSKPAI